MRFILKRVIYLLLLAGVLSVPALMLNSQWRDSVSRAVGDLFKHVRQMPRQLLSDDEKLENKDGQRSLSPLAIQLEEAMRRFHAEGGQISSFNKIFQCGAPRSWVQRTYDDASRTMDQQREGLRVTLVTGEKLEDLAGSLTYWFDRQGQVERITFQGVTGNPAKLVSFAHRSHKMVARRCERDAIFVRDGKNGPLHLLHISRLPFVNVQTQYGRYEITLELNQPGSSLSSASSNVLEGG